MAGRVGRVTIVLDPAPVETLIVAVHIDGGLGHNIYHLPNPVRHDANGRHHFDGRDFPPDEWPSVCGLTGTVYALGGAFLSRTLCKVCEAEA